MVSVKKKKHNNRILKKFFFFSHTFIHSFDQSINIQFNSILIICKSFFFIFVHFSIKIIDMILYVCVWMEFFRVLDFPPPQRQQQQQQISYLYGTCHMLLLLFLLFWLNQINSQLSRSKSIWMNQNAHTYTHTDQLRLNPKKRISVQINSKFIIANQMKEKNIRLFSFPFLSLSFSLQEIRFVIEQLR